MEAGSFLFVLIQIFLNNKQKEGFEAFFVENSRRRIEISFKIASFYNFYFFHNTIPAKSAKTPLANN